MQPYSALARIYDEWMAHLDYDRWADYLCSLMRENGVPPGAAVVDLACGTGLIALRLARRGFRVTGIDRSEEMLTQASRMASREGLSVNWGMMDMRDFRIHRPADCVVCACDGVNYLTSIPDVDRCFFAVAKALRPGGLFLFDISSRDKLLAMDRQFYGQETDSAACLWQNRYDPRTRVLAMDLTFFIEREDGLYERAAETHRQRVHETRELTDALERAGFRTVSVLEAFTQMPPERPSQRIQFAARKTACGTCESFLPYE